MTAETTTATTPSRGTIRCVFLIPFTGIAIALLRFERSTKYPFAIARGGDADLQVFLGRLNAMIWFEGPSRAWRLQG